MKTSPMKLIWASISFFIISRICRLYFDAYYLLLNLITFMFFMFDKFTCKNPNVATRISETFMFSLCISGGWLGGLIAMILFNHKIKKSSFLFTFILTVAVDLMLSYQMS